tara:strand:- start:26200 stop:27114 length:915 start_codon:yes stop_codon:yes gene_type:complete
MNIELELYKKMYLIRACEEAIMSEYNNDGMKTPMHMSMGSEHISSAVCLALGDRAQVFSSYRSHAPFLARTEDTDQFFLEMYGCKESVLGGRGGSMHLCYPEKGFIMSSAIVASQISVACGYAWANKQKKNGKIVVVFFGDGATEEGAFWESLNIASLYKLPIMFVIEDNGLAVHTNMYTRKGKNILNIIDNVYGCDSDSIEKEYPCAYLSMYNKVKKHSLDTEKNFIIYSFNYHRMLEHVGIDEDYEAGYRIKPADMDFIDPVLMMRKKLFKSEKAVLTKATEDLIDKKVQKSLKMAKEMSII